MQLLERTTFLETLAHYGTDAGQGNGRLVLISGESGMGKTVLIEAFQQRTANARWLWGACDGIRTPRPLGPLFDIGMQAGGELAELCRRDANRDQLFAAFLAEANAHATLTVAVIEDVHWADEATIDLLSVLGRRLGRMRALVLATYRDDELADDHPLRVVLGDLATQRATRRMRLPPLSQAAVRDLVGERDVDAAELHRVTGGNPFFVTEILEAGWPAVPPTVRDTPPHWVRIARQPRSSSGRSGFPLTLTELCLRRSTRVSLASIPCLIAGKRPSGHCAPRWSCGVSSAMTGVSAKISKSWPPHSGGCAVARSHTRPSRRPCWHWKSCRRAASWGSRTRSSA
jgi:hypothetical protein